MRFILITALLLTLVGCQSATPTPEASIQPGLQTIREHVRIDDEVIDQGDPWAVIDPVFWTADIYDGEAEYNNSLAPFSREQRYLLAVSWYMAEVNNGGHDQFYYNSTGIVWKDALAGFRDMGLDQVVAILEESAQRMGGNPVSIEKPARSKWMSTTPPSTTSTTGFTTFKAQAAWTSPFRNTWVNTVRHSIMKGMSPRWNCRPLPQRISRSGSRGG